MNYFVYYVKNEKAIIRAFENKYRLKKFIVDTKAKDNKKIDDLNHVFYSKRLKTLFSIAQSYLSLIEKIKFDAGYKLKAINTNDPAFKQYFIKKQDYYQLQDLKIRLQTRFKD